MSQMHNDVQRALAQAGAAADTLEWKWRNDLALLDPYQRALEEALNRLEALRSSLVRDSQVLRGFEDGLANAAVTAERLEALFASCSFHGRDAGRLRAHFDRLQSDVKQGLERGHAALRDFTGPRPMRASGGTSSGAIDPWPWGMANRGLRSESIRARSAAPHSSGAWIVGDSNCGSNAPEPVAVQNTYLGTRVDNCRGETLGYCHPTIGGGPETLRVTDALGKPTAYSVRMDPIRADPIDLAAPFRRASPWWERSIEPGTWTGGGMSSAPTGCAAPTVGGMGWW